MKRSELNSIIEDTIKFMEDRGLPLPPLHIGVFRNGKRLAKRNEEIVENMLGWDITDFGVAILRRLVLPIFTFRKRKLL